MTDNQEEYRNIDDDLNDQAAEDRSEAEWMATLNRLGMAGIDVNKVSDEDLLYLAKRWQFLQVVESSGNVSALDEMQILKAPSGWDIQYYGDAMAASPGRLIFGGGFSSRGDDDEGGGAGLGKGTYFKQGYDTAAEMVRLAQEYGWGGMLVVDGHPDMMRAAWIEAVRIGVRLDGYTPSIADERVRRRVVSQTVEEMHSAMHDLEARIKGGG